MSKLINLSVLHFPHLEIGNKKISYPFIELLYWFTQSAENSAWSGVTNP